MFAYCVVCGMGSRVIALLGGADTVFLPFFGRTLRGEKQKTKSVSKANSLLGKAKKKEDTMMCE